MAHGGQSIEVMTIQGAVNATLVLGVLLLISGSYGWSQASSNPTGAMTLLMGGCIGGLILGMATAFKPTWAPISAPLYALAEGLVLGTISAIYEKQTQGIALQAALLTACTLLGLLGAYRSGLIRATENFKLGVFAATAGIALAYLLMFVVGLFGVKMSFLHDSSPLSIGISLVVVVVAALNLVLDFDFIEEGAKQGAPKHMEWYAAFGLLVTLVWLYLEILRLLAKLSSNRR